MDNEANGRGRPTKRDDETVAIVKKAMSLGFSNRDAAKAAKIHETTLQEWLKDPAFRESVESEMILRRMSRVERIDACEPGWQALAWREERQGIFSGDIRWISPELQIKCRLFEQAQQADPTAVDDKLGPNERALLKKIAASVPKEVLDAQ